MRALNSNELDQRKRKVLQYVIHEYIRTGKPVGSQTIAVSSRLGLSSATIRNVLMELEKDEMITHPHTSAGRIPTDKGYRMYVDSIVELQRLAVQEQTRIHQEYESRMREIEDLMSQTSKMLSSLSHYTGFVMTPKLEKNIFSNIELIPVSPHRILVAMITTSGLAKHFIMNIGMEISKERLKAISRIINESFQGSTLQEVKLNLMGKLQDLQEEYRDMMSLAREIGEEIRKVSVSEIYMDGTSNILSLPDFSNTDDLQNLFKIMEEKQILTHLLEDDCHLIDGESQKSPKGRECFASSKKDKKIKENNSGLNIKQRVHVRIGSENADKALRNLSVVSSTYQLSDRTVGVLGILGPKRMEYPKMIALVDYVSQMVNRLLMEFGEK